MNWVGQWVLISLGYQDNRLITSHGSDQTWRTSSQDRKVDIILRRKGNNYLLQDALRLKNMTCCEGLNPIKYGR